MLIFWIPEKRMFVFFIHVCFFKSFHHLFMFCFFAFCFLIVVLLISFFFSFFHLHLFIYSCLFCFIFHSCIIWIGKNCHYRKKNKAIWFADELQEELQNSVDPILIGTKKQTWMNKKQTWMNKKQTWINE